MAADRPGEMKVQSSVIIASPPEEVWGILIDVESYPELERYVASMHGRIGSDEQLVVVPRSPGYRSTRYAVNVTVTDFQPCTRMVWEGRRWLGLLRGSRTFELTAQTGSESVATELTVTEEYTGLTELLFPEGWRAELMTGLDELTAGVKRRIVAGKRQSLRAAIQ